MNGLGNAFTSVDFSLLQLCARMLARSANILARNRKVSRHLYQWHFQAMSSV